MEVRFWLLTLTPLLALVSYTILLVMVLRHTSRTSVHRFFALYLMVMAVWSFGSAMMRLDPDRILLWNRVLIAGAMVMPLAYLVFVQTFLNQKQGLWVLLGIVSVFALEIANALGLVVTDARFLEGGLLSFDPGPATYFAMIYGVLLWGMAAWYLARAYLRPSTPVMLNRIRYPLIGFVFVVVGTATNSLPALGAFPVDHAANLINALLLAYAILRFQLLDITVVMRKGLVYSIPTAIVGAGYFLIVFLAVTFFRFVTGYQVLLLSLIMAAVAAVAFQPLRDRAQSWVDRLFFREKYDSSLMLQRLSRTAASVLDLDRLTRMILNEIATTMHVERAILFLQHEESGEFRSTALPGLGSNVVMKLRRDHPLVRWLSDHEIVLTRYQMEVMPQFKAIWVQEREDLDRIKAELFVPLLVRNELIGILVLGPKLSDAPYSHDEQLTLTTLANQTAVAIENAWLFSLEQRKVEESAALLDIARAVSSTLGLTRLLEEIAKRTARVCGVDRCSILLLDEQGRTLIPLMSQYGHGARDRDLWRAFREQTYVETVDQVPLVKRVIDEREPVVFDEDSMPFLPVAWVQPFGIKNMLVVPLISKDETIGLMVLDHAEEGQRFTEEQINLATTIGTQVSIAIENARLYEEAIEEKERTETIVDRAFSGIMVIDLEGQIVTLNPEVEAITGYTSQELLGRRLEDLFGPELSWEGSLLSEVMATGERVAPTESSLIGKNGSRDVLLGVTPIREGYLLNFADITRLKEVERLKSSIVANVSHELRAPLASIKAYTELLLDNLEGEDRALRLRFLSIIDQESDWLTDLINDLLDLSRLESEQHVAEKDLLSIKEVIEGVLSLVDAQVRKREITVFLDVPADLPLILADKELMTILVKNLVGNAVKFSTEGGRVDVTVRRTGDNLVLDVTDRGIGIPSEDLPNLFTKFYRSGLAKESGIRGTGLGLVLAREAAEIHDGTIEVVSEVGVGTHVTVNLPIKYGHLMDRHHERK